MRNAKVLLLLLGALLAPQAMASDAVDRAKELFAAYVAGYHSFDPNVVELYADNALIQNRRTNPDGTVRENVFSAPQYKTLVRNLMPVIRARGDKSQYNNPQFVEEARGVRITISRFSELKRYTSPMSMLIGPSNGGRWLILEEKTESIP